MAALVAIIFIIMILLATVIMILVIVRDGHVGNRNVFVVIWRVARAPTNSVLQEPNPKRLGGLDGPTNDIAALVTIEQELVGVQFQTHALFTFQVVVEVVRMDFDLVDVAFAFVGSLFDHPIAQFFFYLDCVISELTVDVDAHVHVVAVISSNNRLQR